MLDVRICLSIWPGFARILSNFSFMVTDGYRLFQRRYCIFTAGPRGSDAYKLVKILLRTREKKAGCDSQLPDKLAIFYVSSGPLGLTFLALQNEEERQTWKKLTIWSLDYRRSYKYSEWTNPNVGGLCRLLGMCEKMDDPGAIVFSSSDKGGLRGSWKMFYSDVTNQREFSLYHGLSKETFYIMDCKKLNINERTHALKRKFTNCTITTHWGRIQRKGIRFFDGLPARCESFSRPA
jgi:hypothetical protein